MCCSSSILVVGVSGVNINGAWVKCRGKKGGGVRVGVSSGGVAKAEECGDGVVVWDTVAGEKMEVVGVGVCCGVGVNGEMGGV